MRAAADQIARVTRVSQTTCVMNFRLLRRAVMELSGQSSKPFAFNVGSHSYSAATVCGQGWPMAMTWPWRRDIASI
jgi:hypothetical protein